MMQYRNGRYDAGCSGVVEMHHSIRTKRRTWKKYDMGTEPESDIMEVTASDIHVAVVSRRSPGL